MGLTWEKMTDIDTTVDTVDVEAVEPTEGLDTESSIPSDGFEGASEDFAQESEGSVDETPIEALFEYEGQQITLEEARNGYLRQADYTRKTQEIAEQRASLAQAEALAQALERNPEATLQALQQAFGVNMGEPVDSYEDMDPESARIAKIEAQLEAQADRERQAAIDAELATLQEQYGEFDQNELFSHAIQGNFPSLKSAYADMHFDSVQTKALEMDRLRQEQEKRRAAAKEATGAVHTGGSRKGAVGPPAQQEFGSFREAYMAAKKQVGL